MLQVIREKFTGGFAIAILVLLTVPFVFFGIDYDFSSSAYAAKVDGTEISAGYFQQRYQVEVRREPRIMQLGVAQRAQFRQALLDSLVREQLIDNFLAEYGYRVSDKQVTDMLQRVPEFQVEGKFDVETYRAFLAMQGTEPSRFEENQRRQLQRAQLQAAIGASAIVTPAEYRRYLNLAAEQRLVTLATLTEEAVADEIEVDEAAIAAFYEENTTLYQLPETADIEYIRIRRDLVAESVEVDEQTLTQYYEDNSQRFLRDEQRQARHILILFDDDEAAAEAKATELLGRLQAGESFEELAAEHSMDGGTASQGGDMGVLTRTQLPDALGDAVFSMQVGQLDGPVKSDFGFHIIRLDNVLEQGPQPFDQVRGELVAEIRDAQADSLYRDLESRLSDAIFDSTDMSSIAATVGMDIETLSRFTRSGGGVFGGNQAAIDAVFDDTVLNGGMISEVIELDAGSSAVFRVVQYHPASRQPLDDVRDSVETAVRAREADALLLSRAEQILAAIDAGEDFGQASEAGGAVVGEPLLISRQDQTVDQAVFFEVFAAGKPADGGSLRGRVKNLGEGYTIYSLDAVLPGRPESIPLAQRDAGKRELAEQSGRNDFNTFVQALYDRADVIINNDLLASQDLLQ